MCGFEDSGCAIYRFDLDKKETAPHPLSQQLPLTPHLPPPVLFDFYFDCTTRWLFASVCSDAFFVCSEASPIDHSK